MIKKLILSCLTLLLLIQPSFSDEEEDLRNLLDKKNDLSGEEFYNELTKLQDQWAIDMIMQIQETDEKDSKQENIVVDMSSLDLLKGSQVDFSEELIGNSFKISNPKTKSSCGCGISFSF